MLALVHINKTGGTTLLHILRKSFGPAHCDVRLWPPSSREIQEDQEKNGDYLFTAGNLRRTRWIYWKLDSIAGHDVVAYSDLEKAEPNIRYFTFLRNPITRCASHFQFMHRSGSDLTLEKWLSTKYYRNFQCHKIAGQQSAEAAIDMIKKKFGFVGLMERFDESLVLFRHWCDDPRLDIVSKPKNVSKKMIKKKVLEDPEQLKLLEEANQQDMELYEHVKNTVFEEQINAFSADRLQKEVEELKQQKEPDNFRSNRLLMGKAVRDIFYKPALPIVSRRMRL